MISSKNIKMENGLSLDDYQKIIETYMQELRAIKSVGFVAWGVNTNLFNSITENGGSVEVPLPTSFSHELGNGLIGIGEYGITLAPQNTYMFSCHICTSASHDAIIESGYYYRNSQNPTDTTNKHGVRRTNVAALRYDNGSLYPSGATVLTKNDIEHTINYTIPIGTTQYPFEYELQPYIALEAPSWPNKPALTRIVYQIMTVPKWTI